MDGMVVVSVVVPFVVCLLLGVPSLLLAQKRNRELVARSPGTLTYGWGYFLGYSGILTGLGLAMAVPVAAAAGLYRGWFPLLAAYGLALAAASYGVLTRRRWGWLVHIPLSLNMGLWAFNSVYFSNRWREMPWR